MIYAPHRGESGSGRLHAETIRARPSYGQRPRRGPRVLPRQARRGIATENENAIVFIFAGGTHLDGTRSTVGNADEQTQASWQVTGISDPERPGRESHQPRFAADVRPTATFVGRAAA
jgi:hypothetical protein